MAVSSPSQSAEFVSGSALEGVTHRSNLTIRSVPVAASPVASFAELMSGNIRYVSDHADSPRRGQQRRSATVSSQNPFAVVFGCADSRVPAEILFDQGLGDLFVIRTAGHVVGPSELGSLEYAVGHLNTPLIAVLAHDSCGAVQAAIDCASSGQMPDDHVRDVLERIVPNVNAARSRGESATADIERSHARAVMSLIPERSPLIADRIAQGRLAIVALKYQLSDGTARVLDSIGPLGAR
ncbi:carbonic anhydrase [Dermatophilus congolensis]|uniref:carbonic anhydrase n=1 Tax=Dermatophilus congolensis TaxID=1863 RepID=UPI001AAF819F|nr:carbonic anhydrase [Dermatophilus congolensis]MBO3140922.1 carbonic anhydrase [Dermatophilus congolensis]MBO3145039.1 carbonic anhydrase [Dermatophilus congolensis]MBO3147628.1 carbonic anhydrase [Dermatophilus congolensis]MBO3149909.1 carbonic anhydrase [Dermatophilus congolensis]MBO3154033.1 carbonic anhydrase [Dermatophilus congolensis]